MTWRVLVVDGDARVRDALCAQLRRRGMHADGADDAERALAILERESADLVITEACLPRRSGLWLLAEVRRRWRGRIPVILLTGWYPDSDQIDAYRSADAVLIKPVPVDTLLTRIARVLIDALVTGADAPATPGREAAVD
ncbi:MAG TPA: response regulator [Longimicrobiales bacterium]